MKNGLSIIIPCYNVEQYITKCLDSIISQNIKKYEIILVDDKSKDNTVSIIKEYINNHQNIDITLIENEVNSGAGCSRNKAIKHAKYDIISFIDADDYIDDDYYNKLLNKMDSEKADLVVCDIVIVDKDSKNRSVALEGKNTKFNYINNGLAASPCNKLFKKELLIKYPFAEGIMNEDIPTVISCLVYSNKISYCSEVCYYYVQHDSSVQNKKFSPKRFDIFKAISILNERINGCENYKEIWDAIIYQQVIMFFIYVVPKEKNVFTRAKYLKTFYKLSKNYKIRQNHFFWDFLERQGTKHKYYYKLLLKLNDSGFAVLSSLLILFYDIYKKLFVRPVIKKNLNIDDLIKMAKKQRKKKSLNTVSVVIPNYNYEKFMIQRLYSILYQTYKINEIIILDDCSTDNSRKLIDEIESKINNYISIKKVYNIENSNCVFKQWQKGFDLASSDYVWIAEADDYCEKNFLQENMEVINNNDNIVLSYSDTSFIDVDGKVIAKSVVPSIDIQESGHWDKSFVTDGKAEIDKYAYLNCTIANVSSVIMKNGKYDDIFRKAEEFKQAGDWRFYLGIFEKGNISFISKQLNYYRVHGNNVTSNSKKELHFNEIKKIHNELNEKNEFNDAQKEQVEKRYDVLKEAWNLDDSI